MSYRSALVRKHKRRMQSIRRWQITQLLTALGFEKREVHPYNWRNGKTRKIGNFWERHEYDLDLVLAQAHERYKHAMKRWHPDVPGGCVCKASEFNLIYGRVRKLCERRMR
jgi:hypothetical protein